MIVKDPTKMDSLEAQPILVSDFGCCKLRIQKLGTIETLCCPKHDWKLINWKKVENERII